MVKTLLNSVPPAQLLINLVDCTGIKGAYHLSDINRLGRPLNNSKGFFPKSAKQPNKMALSSCNSINLSCFLADKRLETGKVSKW